MTTGTRAAIRPASRRRTRNWRLGSTRKGRDAGSPTILSVMALEAQTIARACGKSHVHNLEPEDLVALTHRSRRHGARAAGRHRLDTGPQLLLSGCHFDIDGLSKKERHQSRTSRRHQMTGS